jgi:uncharacterized repeat protein (TIGR01451 family)
MTKRFTPILLVLACTVTVLASLAGASSTLAYVPAWTVTSNVHPQRLTPGDPGEISVLANNVGNAPTNGSAIVVTDKLPPGLSVTGSYPGCVVTASSVSCEYSSVLQPYGAIGQVIKLPITVAVEKASADAVNVVSISGGGAQPESNSETVSFGSGPDGFGIDKLEQVALNEDGSPDTQAGSHPFQYTTTLQLNTHIASNGEEVVSGALVKDLHFNLPPGLIGNPNVVPECTNEQFSSYVPGTALGVTSCPDDTVVGVAQVTVADTPRALPLYNLVPNVGEPARFGFDYDYVPIFLDTAVRSGGDYGVVVSINNISDIYQFSASQVSFWGVPSDPRHDPARGYRCLAEGLYTNEVLGPCPLSPPGQQAGAPFLTLPTSCTGPLRSSVEADSWGTTEPVGPDERPGEYQSAEYTWHDALGPLGLDGCNRLPFSPTIGVTPDGPNASTPTGLAVTEHVPQDDTASATGLAESTVKNTTVALPEGVQISPAGGDGLLACSTAEIGFQGAGAQEALNFSDAEEACPEASKVGTVKITTPLLPNPLTGAAYLAAQDANPFGSLVALYIVVRDPVSGVLVKAAGEVVPNAVTGQLVATFKNTPQLPYENLELHFFGSARAPLTTPPLCGVYTTHSSIEGWSGNAPAEPSSSFQITAGPGGGPCSNPRPFAPGFQAGSTNIQAGAFTPFQLTMTRPDADQTLSGVELHMPPGLLGTLSTVQLCGEPQAAQGTCGEASLIGRTVVSAGLGDSPYTVTGGKVFITGPYKGAPYGLSIVNPAVAGPFNLGTVVVRAQIRVDPHTAALTIVSDPLPTMLDGIPLQIQHVQVSVERPNGFTFNATNCEPMQITGTLSSSEGASSSQSTRYQVTNCLDLAFKPTLTASTSGKTSRADGASLSVKLGYPAGPYDANIAKVKVELPKQLPSRLTTLQKACLASTFEANPAACPAASLVGHATATTPVLPVPLTGPAYFVSHGGEAFPSLIIVLQGYGVTVDLVGSTFISKSGITSSTFKTVPDVPVGSFELTIPEGPYSALSANANLCKSKLAMPTEFVAQNGVVLERSTKIKATGCPRAKRATHKRKRAHVKKKPKKLDSRRQRRS